MNIEGTLREGGVFTLPSIDLVLVGVSTLRLAHRKLLRVLLLVVFDQHLAFLGVGNPNVYNSTLKNNRENTTLKAPRQPTKSLPPSSIYS